MEQWPGQGKTEEGGMKEALSGVAGLIGEVEGEVQEGGVDMGEEILEVGEVGEGVLEVVEVEEEILEVVEELPWQWVGLQLGQGLGVAEVLAGEEGEELVHKI